MKKILMFNEAKRIELFEEMTMRTRIPQAIVEKDFWVTWVLGQIFADDVLSKILMFKGGTSLSKVFHLIDRFSEDIDLILDWRLIANEETFDKKMTKNKQDKFNKKVREDGQKYINSELLNMLNNTLAPLCQCSIDDENCIKVQYPYLFTDDYVKSEIKLEVGPFASWLPSNTYEIKSFVGEQFPHLFENPTCKVKAINAERTFWEKATILHQEANRPQDKVLPTRYARHYYDLAMMTQNDVLKDKVLSDFSLLQDVVEFKQKYYSSTWAKYEEININGLKLLPQNYRFKELEEDYRNMQNMFFGRKLEFVEIINILDILEQEIENVRIIQTERVDEVIARVQREYDEKIKVQASSHTKTPDDKTHKPTRQRL